MKRIWVFVVLLCFGIYGRTADYYVSPAGDNENPGTFSLPLKTIQAGIVKLQPGDVLHVLPGVYRESANFIRSGSLGNPIKVIAEPGTVILNGTEEINGEWIPHEGNIYKTAISGPVKQLFYHDTMMVEARWPNMTFPDDLWKRGVWATSDQGSSLGNMKDAALAATGIDWTGALAVLNIEAQFWTWTSEVTVHSAGSNTFQYRTDNLAGIRSDKDYNDDSYYLTGKLEALDFPGEWFFDPEYNMLYVYKPGGGEPQPGEIRVKRISYGLTASSKSNITISGLDFFACTFQFSSCNNFLIEKCAIQYPSYSRKIPERTTGGGVAPCTNIKGSGNVIRECHIAHSSGNGLKVTGDHNLVENNLIHDVCWSGTLDYKAIASDNSGNNYVSHNTIRMNTVYNGGNSLLGFSGPYDVVELNHVYSGGRMCKDVSIIYTLLPRCEHSHIRYNWVHNVHPPHIALGIRGDDKTRRLNVYRNVTWDIGWEGIVVKGDENRIYNNTTFDCGKAGIYLESGMEPSKPWHDHIPEVMANENSYTYNNLVENMYANRFNPVPMPGDVSHNREEQDYFGLLVNRMEYDFRPRFGSELINEGAEVPGVTDPMVCGPPDIGAYEYGDSTYWIPGHRINRASFPIPSRAARVSSDIIDLIWKQAYRAFSYDVYFGNSAPSVQNANHESDEFIGNQQKNIYSPGKLKRDSTYYWRIDAIFNDTTVKGEVWKFTVLSDIAPAVYKVTLQIYAALAEDTVLMEGVKVNVPGMLAYSNEEGIADIYKQSAGYLRYTLFKKGFISKQDSVLILSDTLLTDTLTEALNAYELQVNVVDADTRKLLPGCTIRLNGMPEETDSTGFTKYSDLSYGFFDIAVEKAGYISYTGQIEIFSDSTLVIDLQKIYYEVQVKVLDRTSGEPLYRAVIYKGENIWLTGTNGIAEVEFSGGGEAIHIEHADHFDYDDTLDIFTDSTILIRMTKTRADLMMEVYAGTVRLKNALLELNGIVRQTDQNGQTFFSQLPAREFYVYRVEKEGFHDVKDTLFLEIDTTVTVSLTEASSVFSGSSGLIQFYPNPATEMIYVKVAQESQVSLIDLHGRMVLERLLFPDEGRLDLHEIKPGLYLLRIRTGGEVIHFKLQKSNSPL